MVILKPLNILLQLGVSMYYLTLKNGTVLEFYVLSCAEVFRDCYGGKLVYRDLELLAA